MDRLHGVMQSQTKTDIIEFPLYVEFRKEKRKQRKQTLKYRGQRGAWLDQSVKGLPADFSSGHDLTVHGIEPCVRHCAHSAQPAWDSLCLCLTVPCCLSLSPNK